MENEENKVSFGKNDNEVNNETNASSYQNEDYGQQEQQKVGSINLYGDNGNSDRVTDQNSNQNNSYYDDRYQTDINQKNSYYENGNMGSGENNNADAYGSNGNQNPYGNTDNSWNNAGHQDVNGQGASQSTFSPSGFSIASLVLGILSLVCCCFWYVSGIFAVLGLVFSIIVLVKHKPGKGMAIAGLICSAIGLIIAMIMGIMVVYIGMNMSADDYKKIIDQINSME